MSTLNNIEILILSLFDYIRTPFLDKFFVLVSYLGNKGILFIALGILLLIFKKTRRCGVVILLSLTLGFLIGNVTLKPLVARLRPYQIKEFSLIIPYLSDYSFPSGHTLHSFATGMAIYYNHKKTGRIFIVFAILMAISRLYLFVHFPTDVIAGAFIGLICAFISHKVVKRKF